MFKNQIPEFPNFGRSKALAAKPYLTNSGSDIYPQPHDQPQGWGLSFFSQIHHGPTGRSAGSGFWSGLANLVWWIDRERGVAGLVSSQILPFGGKQWKFAQFHSGRASIDFAAQQTKTCGHAKRRLRKCSTTGYPASFSLLEI